MAGGCWMFISFSFDQTEGFLAGGGVYMKHSKFVWERFATAIKIDRVPLFDVHLFLLRSDRPFFGEAALT